MEAAKAIAEEPVALSYASTHLVRPQRLPGDHHVVYGIKLVLTAVVLLPALAGILAVFLFLIGILDTGSIFDTKHF